jgi:hypothetical protein
MTKVVPRDRSITLLEIGSRHPKTVPRPRALPITRSTTKSAAHNPFHDVRSLVQSPVHDQGRGLSPVHDQGRRPKPGSQHPEAHLTTKSAA